MKTFRFALALVSLLILQPLILQAQWVQTNGPYGCNFGPFTTVVDGLGDTVILGFYYGVARSTDRGVTWTDVSIGDPSDELVTVATAADGGGIHMFVAAMSGKVYHSTDLGTSWTRVGIIPRSVNSLIGLHDSAAGTLLFAGTRGGVYRSDDYGVTWREMNSGLTPVSNLTIYSLAAIPNGSGSSTLLTRTSQYVYRSTDYGMNWSYANTGLTLRLVSSFLTVLLPGGEVIIALTDSGVYRSTNDGISWNRGNFIRWSYSGVLFPDNAGGSVLIAANSDQVYRSTDLGDSWTEADSGLFFDLGILGMLPRASGTPEIYAGSSGSIYRSTNNGSSWEELPIIRTTIGCLTATHDLAGPILYAASGGNLFLSTDDGGQWEKRIFSWPYNSTIRSISSCPTGDGGTLLYLYKDDGYVFSSTDHGANWIPSDGNTPSIRVSGLVSLPNGAGGATLFVSSTDRGVFRSIDNGENWTSVNNGLQSLAVWTLVAGPDGKGGMQLFAGSDTGIFRSTDNGINWNRVGYPITDVEQLAIAVDSAAHTEIIASDGDSLYRSSDYGTSWSNITFRRGISIFAVVPAGIFTYYPSGGLLGGYVYYSPTHGESWNEIHNELPGGTSMCVLDSILYMGTNRGVWKYPLSQVSQWNPIRLDGDVIHNGPAAAAPSLSVIEKINPHRHPIATRTKSSHSTTSSPLGDGIVSLHWSMDSHPDFNHYSILVDVPLLDESQGLRTSGGRTDTSLLLSGLYDTMTYSFRVEAIDNASLERDYSNTLILTTGSPLPIYDIIVSSGPHGHIGPQDTVMIKYGQARKFVITPDAHYHLDSLLVDEVRVDSTTSYTFVNATTNHTIRAVFAIDTYTITASTGANGNVTPSGGLTLGYGSTQRFTITPSIGYHVDSVIVDGVKVDSIIGYTFRSVSTNHSLWVVFRINSYTLTATAGTHGSISPSGTIVLTYGANQLCTITPAVHYHVDSVLVDAQCVDSITSYTFMNVTASHTIRVVFISDTCVIAAASSLNGVIKPSGVLEIMYDTTQTFTITPDWDCHIDSVVVDGVNMGPLSGYVFRPIRISHTINAYFSINSPWLIDVSANWNIVSLPVVTREHRTAALFAAARSNAFSYLNSYQLQDSLTTGPGYWLRFDQDQRVQMAGDTLLTDSIVVQAGWNLIGSISFPVAVTSIVSIPGGLTTTAFFGYNNGYLVIDTIHPGKGYWVKANAAGTLILSAGGSTVLTQSGNISRIRIIPTSDPPPPPPNEKSNTKTAIPKQFALNQNYPNPFNPSTRLQYALPVDSKVRLVVFNLLGQVVAELVNGVQAAGYNQVEWNASAFSSGIYFYRLEATSTSDASKTFTSVKKMVLIK